jgi:hypothetical protein
METAPKRHLGRLIPALTIKLPRSWGDKIRNTDMSTRILGALAALALCITPAAAMDCGKMLDSHTVKITQMTKESAEKRAALTRMAIRGYESCKAGDMLNAEKFFAMITSN